MVFLLEKNTFLFLILNKIKFLLLLKKVFIYGNWKLWPAGGGCVAYPRRATLVLVVLSALTLSTLLRLPWRLALWRSILALGSDLLGQLTLRKRHYIGQVTDWKPLCP